METPAFDPDLYQRLVVISHEAFALALYEVAYHALLGALHWADTVHDVERLREVHAIGIAQRAWIVRYAPDHRIAPQMAALRGNRSIYDSLDLQVRSMLARAEEAPESTE
jgi:hypothetical protein